MSARTSASRRVSVYIAAFAVALAAVLALTAPHLDLSGRSLLIWLGFTVMFAFAEYAIVIFHHEPERQALSLSEAVLVPMLVAFPLPEVVWGVTLGTALVAVAYRRIGIKKAVFNIAEYGCAATVAAAIAGLLRDGLLSFSPRGALAAVVGVALFALLTHLFVSGAIAISERKSLKVFLVSARRALGWNLFGGVGVGVFFAAAYVAAQWTIFLFPPALLAVFLGYRAVLRQMGERERIEKLHDATRALVASPDLDHAVVGFLAAVEDIASGGEARAVIAGPDGYRWTAVRDGEPVAVMEPTAGTPLEDLMTEVRRADGMLVVGQDVEGPGRSLAEALGARSLVAVTLDDDDEGGCLVVLDRVGADEFGPAEAKMLQALAQELVLSLDSHRLFSQIVEERERFLRIFAGSQEGICLLDTQGKVIAWNPALEAITGYTSKEMVGSILAERLVVRRADERRLDTGQLVAAQPDEVLEIVTRDGPARWVALLSGAVKAGAESGHVILVRDVTSERGLEEAKSDFLSTISHELRTPLTAIKGSLQVLARGDEVTEPIRQQMVGVMQRGSDRLERLVLNLLFVSQIELDGAPRILPQEVDLEEVLHERMAPLVPEHTSVDVVTAGRRVLVRGDRERLSQVVEHLIDNAVKFGAGTPIKVELSAGNGFAELAVSDRGPGIAKADRERVFERFVRLGAPLRRETQGAGVGLFIVKESVTAMGGSVTVESESGQGTTFRVTVPLARPVAVPDTG